jgi:hypothetical protein
MAIFNTVYGGEPKWKPWTNTIAYYKFDGDSLDYSWNWYNVTSVTSYDTLSSWIKVAYFSGKLSTSNTNTNLWYDLFKVDQDITISFYVKPSSFWSEWTRPLYISGNWSYRVSRINVYSNKLEWGLWNWWFNYATFSTSISTSAFRHIVLVYNHTNKTVSMYKNWTLVSTVSTSWYSLFTDCTQAIIWYDHWYNSSEYMWETIFEKSLRTAEQVANYYNLTKSNYWL